MARYYVSIERSSGESVHLNYEEDEYDNAVEEYNDACEEPGVLAQLEDLYTGEVIGDGEPIPDDEE